MSARPGVRRIRGDSALPALQRGQRRISDAPSGRIRGVQLIPSGRQWRDWSLPNKLGALSFAVGMLFLALYGGAWTMAVHGLDTRR